MSNHPDGIQTLTRWFLKDQNAVPPTYVLQPITGGSQSWPLTESHLLQLLRSAATEAEAAGDITAEQKQQFFTSGEWHLGFVLCRLT